MIELVVYTEDGVTTASLYAGEELRAQTGVATEREAKAWAYGKLDGVYDDSRPVEVSRTVTYRFEETA